MRCGSSRGRRTHYAGTDQGGTNINACSIWPMAPAEMIVPGIPASELPKSADGGISRAGTYHLLFANVDHQLTLMIGGRAVKFDKPTNYSLSDGPEVEPPVAGEHGDFSPIGIGSIGAGLRVSHLRVSRDIYYTYIPMQPDRVERPQFDPIPCRPRGPKAETGFAFPRRPRASWRPPAWMFEPAINIFSSAIISTCRWETTVPKARTGGSAEPPFR